eukprot:1148622-Pelagomonas_calceolata.AAC.3
MLQWGLCELLELGDGPRGQAVGPGAGPGSGGRAGGGVAPAYVCMCCCRGRAGSKGLGVESSRDLDMSGSPGFCDSL